MEDNRLKYIDLFAGCGGLSLGMHQSKLWKGIFAIEKSSDAFSTLRFNLIENNNHFDWPEWFPKKEHDINEVLKKYKKELFTLKNKIDLVAGGPPCQGFSTAGRRIESDKRNLLINSYISFIEHIRPKMIFFENVRGFTIGFKDNKKRGKAYSSYVLNKLSSLGYNVHGELIDFSEFGVPQKRTRFILVGIRKEINNSDLHLRFFNLLKSNKFNFLSENDLDLSANLQDAISDLLQANGIVNSPDSNGFRAGRYGKIKSKYQKKMRQNIKKYHIPDSHRFAKHSQQIEERFSIAINENLSIEDYRLKFNLKKTSTKLLIGNMPTPTLTTLPDDYIHYLEPRILTVREYARLQSFPDIFEFKGKYTTGGKRRIEEVPRYSQIGNAIPPLFGQQAGIVLYKLLSNE